MFPRTFSYIAPSTLEEAISILDKYPEDAKILAGGHSLVPMMKLRLASPKYVVDISRLDGLEYITESDGMLTIGALTTHHAVETSKLILAKCPIMSEAAGLIGDPQVRNAGTIGGALAHGEPAGDWGSIILSLNGELKTKSPSGERVIKIDEFFLGPFETALKPNEILTEIKIPLPPQPSSSAYLKLERKVGDFATVGVGVQLKIDDQTITDVGIGLTAVGFTPLRARKAEEILRGKVITDAVIEEAAQAATDESDPTADLHGSVKYKKLMVKEFTIRALKLAIKRTKN